MVKNKQTNWQYRRCKRKRHRFDPRFGKIPWRKKRQPTAQFLPGKLQGHRSVAGYSSSGSIVLHDGTNLVHLTVLPE